MRQYILITDNKTIKDSDVDNKKLIGKKFEVGISEISLEDELKRHFKWRKNCNYERLKSLGSQEYDAFIIHLFKLNY